MKIKLYMSLFKFIKKISYFMSLLSITLVTNVKAVDLQEALTSTYETNEDMKKIKVIFMNKVQEFPKVISNYFMPDINAEMSVNKLKEKDFDPLTPSVSQSNKIKTKRLIITQQLFNGGSGIAALKAAQEDFRAAKANFYDNEQKVLFGAISAYLDYIEARETVIITDKSIDFHSKELESIKAKLQAGEATKTDVARSNSRLADAQYQKSVAFSNLQSTKAKFKDVIGLEAAEVEEASSPEITGTYEEFLQQALHSNYSLKEIEYSLKSAKSGVTSSMGRLLPTLSATASAEKRNVDEQNPFRKSGTNMSTSLRLDIPILTKGGAEHIRVRQARYAAKQKAIELDNARKNIHTEALSLWEKWQAAKNGLISAKNGVEAAKLALEGMQNEYNVGLKTIVELLNAEKDLFDMQLKEIKAKKVLVATGYQMQMVMSKLTAKSLLLNVKYFDPDKEFNSVKMRVIGF